MLGSNLNFHRQIRVILTVTTITGPHKELMAHISPTVERLRFTHGKTSCKILNSLNNVPMFSKQQKITSPIISMLSYIHEQSTI